jgi:hypothetical protein
VALLNQAVSMWRTAESQGRVYEQARVLLDQLARDLRSTAIRSHAGDDNAWIRFLCDYDPWGRQRLRFVRATSGETSHGVLRDGGRLLSVRSPDVYDGRRDAGEAEHGSLGAPGGLMEVFYGRDPRPDSQILWRGVRTPIGGAGSLFHDRTVEGEPSFFGRAGTKTTPGAPGGDESYAGVPFRRAARPIADGVLFLGFTFWGPTTNTWAPTAVPLRRPRAGERSGPLLVWDSTRAILDMPAGSKEEFAFQAREDSLNDASDDLFPAMVEITLVLAEEGESLGLRLGEDIGKGDEDFLVSRPVSLPEDPRDRFLLIEGEWIAVEECRGRQVAVVADGRGVRDTAASPHRRGSAVEIGLTFRRVVEIPGHRRHLLEDNESPRKRRYTW